MKKSIIFLASLLISVALFSQTLSNQLLGYQEPYAKMEAQAVDSVGNVYYTGTFKGSLVIEGQTVLNGNGGDDVFLAKTNASGNLLWAKKYGDLGFETSESLLFHQGALYLTMRIEQTSVVEGISITAYPAGSRTHAILKLDTSGKVLWTRRTSLPVEKIMANKNQLFIKGMLQPLTSPTLYLEDSLLVGPASSYRSFFVYMDTAGNYLGHKLARTGNSFTNADILQAFVTTNGRLFYMVGTDFGQTMDIGNQTLNFPQFGNYFALVKTDTSFSALQYKVLNPQGEFYTNNLENEFAGFSMAPKQDSVYMIVGGTTFAGIYQLDGYFTTANNRNLLVVMDTNFVTKRVKTIGDFNIGAYANGISVSHVVSDSGHYYFRGRLNGKNNVPTIDGTQAQPQLVHILYGIRDSFDINGPSKSFLIKATKDFSKLTLKWLGLHTPYESQSVGPHFFQVQQNRVYFLHKMDNVWNPWITDTSLQILKGEMKSNADGAEIITRVNYFSDGTKGLVGVARGRTALDTSNSPGITTVGSKSDLFVVSMDQNEQVKWYKRIYHSFSFSAIEKIVARNDKLYVSVVFQLPKNLGSSNYVRIDTSTYFINNVDLGRNTMLIVFDKSGQFEVIRLNPPFHQTAVFDVFRNGDLGFVSSITTINLPVQGKQFSTLQGFYVARMDPQGTLKDAVKFMITSIGSIGTPYNLLIDTLTDKFNFVAATSISAGSTNKTITYHNGLTAPLTFPVTNPQPSATTTKQYFLAINGSFNSVNKSATIGPMNSVVGTTATLKSKHYLVIGKTNMKDSIYYNTNLIIPDTSSNVRFILAVDTALNYVTHKIISSATSPLYNYSLTNITAHGDHLYISGSNSGTTQIDTVKIGHAGLTDAITVQFDSALVAKKVFRIASIYNETMYSCDLFKDSLISFVYTSQGSPSLINGRFAARNTGIASTDLDENAYIQTVLLKTGIVTAIDEPARIEGFRVFPNPVLTNMVWIDLGNTETGRYHWMLYNTEGRLIESNQLMWSPGQSKQIQFGKKIQAGNYVLLIKTGQQRMLKAVKLTVL